MAHSHTSREEHGLLAQCIATPGWSVIIAFSLVHHVHLKFGEYIQTHEEHTNEMYEHTLGAICLGPTGNSQGGHWFMGLGTGARITQHTLTVPTEVIQCVTQLGHEQGMPDTLTFADYHWYEDHLG